MRASTTSFADRPRSDASKSATSAALRTLADLPGPRGLPVVGNFFDIDIARAHTILDRWADRYGPIFRFRIVHRDVIAIADVDLINEILRDRPEGFRRRKSLQDAMIELGVNGVFGAEGADWRRQRKLAMHALNTKHLREFFDRLGQVTSRLHRRWDRSAGAGAVIDVQHDLMRFTVDVTSGLAFGNDLNTLEQEGDTIQQHLNKVFPALARRLLAPFPYWRWMKLPADRVLDRALDVVLKLVNALVADARRRMVGRPGAPANFLDAMVATQSDEANAFADAEVVGNVLTMLLAGEDTTANTLAWMMHFMTLAPEVQAKMQAEADRVLGDAALPPDHAATEALPYIEAVAHEAMRLLPVAPFLALEPNYDAVIGDVRVPKGTAVYLLTGHEAKSAAHFVDPQVFRPERWLEAAQRDNATGRAQTESCPHDTRAFLPFGAGPRFCPGRHLAMLEIKMVAAMLCRNFTVERAPDAPPVEEVFSFAMMPKNLFVVLRYRGHARSAG